MCEVDAVKASTASDPLDVLPTTCALKNFIVVLCENQNQKKNETGYFRLKTEPNRTEFEKSKPTQP